MIDRRARAHVLCAQRSSTNVRSNGEPPAVNNNIIKATLIKVFHISDGTHHVKNEPIQMPVRLFRAYAGVLLKSEFHMQFQNSKIVVVEL